MFSEISEGRRVKPCSEIYRPGDLLPYTLRGISRKYALLLGHCIMYYRITKAGQRVADDLLALSLCPTSESEFFKIFK
jgi:hypothetical protein